MLRRAAAIAVGLLMVMNTVVNVSAAVGTVTVNSATQNPNPVGQGASATFTVSVVNSSGSTTRQFKATGIAGTTGLSLPVVGGSDCVTIGPGATGTLHVTVATTTATPVGTDPLTLTVNDFDTTDCSGTLHSTGTGDGTIVVAAAMGAMTVTPTTVLTGATGLTLAFDFSDNTATNFSANSRVELTVPAGWTAPTTAAGAGHIAVANLVGTSCNPSVTGITGAGPWVVAVSMACAAGDHLSITYSGVTAPATPGIVTFPTATHNGAGGTALPIATSPTVQVNSASDGDGVMTVSPTTALAVGAGQTLTFDFTNDSTYGFLPTSRVELVVPAGWTAPTTATGNGHIAAANSVGTSCSPIVSGVTGTGPWTVTVTMACAAGDHFTIT